MTATDEEFVDGHVVTCPGPLVWYDVEGGGAILECAVCSYVIVSGNFHDPAHAYSTIMREGLVT